MTGNGWEPPGNGEGWGAWDEFSQVRRPRKGVLEFRSSSPVFMLLAGAIVIAAWQTSWWAAAVAPLVFLIGRGVVVNGHNRTVVVWQGWIYFPVFECEFDATAFLAVRIARRSGDEAFLLSLVHRSGEGMPLKACPTVEEARAWAAEVHRLSAIPVADETAAPRI